MAAVLLDDSNQRRRFRIDPGTPMMDENVKTVMIEDPDRNSIAFAQ
jgi:hypothetical protein